MPNSRRSPRRKCPMISQRKRTANRRNARSSTGPRSAAGKAKASQNALKHGLAIPVLLQRGLALQAHTRANAMAAEYDGRLAPGDLLALSVTEIDLERIAAARS